MNLKEASERPISESQNGKAVYPYVVAESEVRGLVRSLDIHYLGTVAARFQTVADLTSGAFEDKIDRLDPSDLMLIEQIAAEDNGAYYRRIMSAIIGGVGQGRHGINAAHLTASLAVLMTFRWSPEYRSALDDYRHRLRREKLNRFDRGTRGRSVARPTNDQMTKMQQRRNGSPGSAPI